MKRKFISKLSLCVILLITCSFKTNLKVNSSQSGLNKNSEKMLDPYSLLSLAPMVMDAIPGLEGIDFSSITGTVQAILPIAEMVFGDKSTDPVNINAGFNEIEARQRKIITSLSDIDSRISSLSIKIDTLNNRVSRLEEISKTIFKYTIQISKQISDSERKILAEYNEGLSKRQRNDITTTIRRIRNNPQNASDDWNGRKVKYENALNYLYEHEVNLDRLAEMFYYTIFYLTMENPENLDRSFNSPEKNFIKDGFNIFLNRINDTFLAWDREFIYSFGVVAQYGGIAWAHGEMRGTLDSPDNGKAATLRHITQTEGLNFSNRSLLFNWTENMEPGSDYEKAGRRRNDGTIISIYDNLSNPDRLKVLSISRDHYYTILQAGLLYKNGLGL